MKQDIVIARVPCSAAGFQAEECQGWIERATSPDERHSCLLAAESFPEYSRVLSSPVGGNQLNDGCNAQQQQVLNNAQNATANKANTAWPRPAEA